MSRKFTELELVRREKIKKYHEIGIKPWSAKKDFSDNSKSLEDKYGKFSKEELHEQKTQASVVCRIMTTRGPFIIGKDSTGPLQAYIAKKTFPKIDQLVKTLDIGDIIFFEGEVMKTSTGSLTIRASKLSLLAKSLRPLPEKFHGLKDVEERYRRRYVDLIVNDDVKNIFWQRTKIISSIRRYFDDQEYMEADTPILQAILGGAAAKPFTTHHNALDMEFYLRIATELPLKRLLVGGIDRVYEIGRLFRNEGIDTTHNPEFTTIEFYEAHTDLNGMMKRTEEVIAFAAKAIDKEIIEYQGHKINVKGPFKKVNMVDAVNEKTGKDFRVISFDDAISIAISKGIKIESYFKLGHIINELFEKLVEDTIIEPTFIYGHPIEISPLAALDENDQRFTQRAELFILGREYANMFTELNNPIDQMKRFEGQLLEREAGNDEANEIDLDFVEALEYGMPPAGGCGIGIDRLVMLLTGQTSIREVILFPHLKNKKDNNE
ncbi:lysine--tRNA ligase [Candidatus Mycoplasma mahonii]|uniref:lysine--tRNA ligase n=1 Tax=Candidatus Mycoplasma mahonii TaxID=3004105 RepID=UPI0026EA48B8|nr:lysine--tRNA ligase [Candidatus Mycoplasma mahonii]WKX02366.1 lysine--tRNA ligase [Candidatus Mycoplasma mahonii]